MRFEKEITVNAAPEKVFDYIADLARHSEWVNRPLNVKMTSSGPVGVGSTFSSTGKQFGTHTDTVTIVEYVPSSKVVFRSEGDAGTVRHWFGLAPEGSGTRLSKGLEFEKMAPTTKMASFVVKRVAPKDLEANLEKIKALVEGNA